jgi:hypothetical protein
VSSQDDGAYLLFTGASPTSWTPVNDGLGGVGGTPCPLAIPAGVLAAWNWAAGSCRPPGQ